MREDINKKHNKTINGDALPFEVEEIYKSTVLHEKLKFNNHKRKKLKFPILDPNDLNNHSDVSFLCEFNILDGCSFLQDNQLVQDKNVPDLVGLLANFIIHRENKYTTWDSPYYKCIPSMFVDFAYHSRIDSGWGLVERCARHALDTRGLQLLETKAKLFTYKDER